MIQIGISTSENPLDSPSKEERCATILSLRRLAILVALLLCHHPSFGQDLEYHDFDITRFAVLDNVSRLTEVLGNPDSITGAFRTGQVKYSIYHYPGLAIWVYDYENVVWSVEIVTPRYATSRGVRIGDSMKKVIGRYGPSEVFHVFTSYHETFDSTFHAYTEFRAYSLSIDHINSLNAAFFFKSGRVMRIILYLGGHDDWDPWDMLRKNK